MYLYAARALASARHQLFEAMPALPTDIVEKVDKILNDEHLPVLAKVSQLFTCLADNGLGYYQKVAPKDTLTHPANRGGSLLSSTDVWSKGLRMLSIGVQPAMLQSGAVCFELSNIKEKRESQIAANVSLVEGSGNSLAPVNGQEKFLTVATSNCFMKVACYGRLCVRSTLHLTGKEKMGREPKGFESLSTIAKLFIEELDKVKGPMATGSAASATEDDEGLKVEDLVGASPAQVALLKNEHMKIGSLSLG
eukprot:s1274_g13.t1